MVGIYIYQVVWLLVPTQERNGAKTPYWATLCKFDTSWESSERREKLGVKWTKGSGDLRARPHPARLPNCGKWSLRSKGNYQHIRAYANPSLRGGHAPRMQQNLAALATLFLDLRIQEESCGILLCGWKTLKPGMWQGSSFMEGGTSLREDVKMKLLCWIVLEAQDAERCQSCGIPAKESCRQGVEPTNPREVCYTPSGKLEGKSHLISTLTPDMGLMNWHLLDWALFLLCPIISSLCSLSSLLEW